MCVARYLHDARLVKEPASEEDEDDETLPLKRPPTDTNSRVCVADETSAVKNVVAPLVIRKKPGRKRKADAHESEPKRRKIKLPIEVKASLEYTSDKTNKFLCCFCAFFSIIYDT